MRHKNKKIDLYQQRQLLLTNYEPQTFGHGFYEGTCPCVSSMGWKVDDAEYAQKTAVERGQQNLKMLTIN